MASIFTRIMDGDIPGRLVWEDDLCVSMVDIRPLHEGHSLVIPRQEVDQWTDLSGPTAAHLMTVAHQIGRAQRQIFSCERIGLLIAGFEVPHTHLHVVPMDHMGHLDFRNANGSVPAEELDRVADRLRRQLADDGHGAAVVSIDSPST